MTPSYDLILQMWSSEVYNAAGLELSTSLELAEPTTGPAFTFRLPIGTSELLRAVTFIEGDQRDSARYRNPSSYIEDPFQRYQNEMAKDFYDRTDKLLLYFRSSKLSHIDLTDVPFVACESSRGVVGWYGGGSGYTSKPDETSVQSLFRSPDTSPPPQKNVALNWAFIKRLLADRLLEDRLSDYLPDSVEGLTVVNFPCVSFPSWKRYDEAYNAEAWGILANVMQRYSRPGSGRTLSLTFAESSSELSNMERSEEQEYEHTIHISYEDAVRAVTEKGYRQIAPFVASFEDLRVHRL
ncbi:hypothetical protein PENSPDRAFT_659494 [Peniophora sp. CONT]|nr:hypothetical protein PENSPDRAFT_659494 [Peniophora sp. CONT]